MYGPDQSGLFGLAIVGMIAIAAVVLIGVPVLGWWVVHHVSIAW